MFLIQHMFRCFRHFANVRIYILLSLYYAHHKTSFHPLSQALSASLCIWLILHFNLVPLPCVKMNISPCFPKPINLFIQGTTKKLLCRCNDN